MGDGRQHRETDLLSSLVAEASVSSGAVLVEHLVSSPRYDLCQSRVRAAVVFLLDGIHPGCIIPDCVAVRPGALPLPETFSSAGHPSRHFFPDSAGRLDSVVYS